MNANNQNPVTVDPLVIAYIAMGVGGAIRTYQVDARALEEVKEHVGMGEDGIVQEAIAHAAMVDGYFTECDAATGGSGFPAVFVYEVAEPFGEWYIQQWAETQTQPDEKAARAWLDECVAEIVGQKDWQRVLNYRAAQNREG